MRRLSDKTIYFLISALLSLLTHCLIILFSGEIEIWALPASLDLTPADLPQRMRVRSVKLPPREEMRNRLGENMPGRRLVEELKKAVQSRRPLEDIFKQSNIPLLPAPIPPTSFTLEPPEPGRLEAVEDESVAVPPAVPRPKILALENVKLSESELDYRPTMPDVERELATGMLPSVFDDDLTSSGAAGFAHVAAAVGLSGDEQAAGVVEIEETAPAAPPELPAPPKMAESSVMKLDPAEVGREDMRPIDQLLNIDMVVHREKDGGGCFRIDISPNLKSEKLRAVAKDVLLLIDCSNSISSEKLDTFKTAAYNALEYLNARDRFNIVSFRAKPEPLFDGYVPVAAANIGRARRYIRYLERGGMTDVYAGLAPFIGGSQDAPGRPLTVFIMTDGNSTVRDKLGNRQLLRKVAEVNHPATSIYSVSVGKKANRTLLDLLALTNRGMPLHQPELEGFSESLIRFIANHSDIIVSELDYTLVDGMAANIYPKKLPHLYRNETLSVYGRFAAGTKEIVIQIIGRSASNNLEEVVFRGQLEQAREVGADLRTDWLAHKAFDIFTRNLIEPAPALQAELNRIRSTYNIELPVLDED